MRPFRLNDLNWNREHENGLFFYCIFLNNAFRVAKVPYKWSINALNSNFYKAACILQNFGKIWSSNAAKLQN